jgi:hypothetical protein
MRDVITIKGVEYALGYNLRVRMIYERLTNKFLGESMFTFENIVYFFSILKAFNKDFPYDLEQLINIIEEDESIFNEFLLWAEAYNRRNMDLLDTTENEDDDKKKG